MQQQRRHNPYPTTWEIPLGLATLVLITLALGVHVGRGLATLVAGHGWTWPTYLELGRSLPAVISGNAHAGLPAGTLPPDATAPVLAGIIVAELVAILGILTAAAFAWTRWGPDRMLGMATTSQATHILGSRRLRDVRHIIRPDLYRRKRRPLP